jgi:DNA polymerase elongation subunit (family B)
MINLESTPWFICKEGDTNYCAYVDTDSNYYNAEPLLRHLYPNFDEMGEEERDNKLEDIALKYQDLITDYYSEMSTDVFNVPVHHFDMKTECIIRSAYFRATRRYAQWITKKEGEVKNELDIKGLEFMKANFPPIFGKFFNKILKSALTGTQQGEIDKWLLDFRKYIMSKECDIAILGNPTAVKTLNNYIQSAPKPGEMFSLIKSKAPAPVKAAIKYNDLLSFWGLDKQHSRIVQGDKIKWIYLRDNPYRIEALAFLDFDMPEKIRILLDEYADKHKSFESILESKLEGFYHDLGWSLNLNPYRNMFFSF